MKRFSTFIFERDLQDDPIAKAYRNAATGSVNMDDLKNIPLEARRGIIDAAGRAERANNPNSGESGESQRDAAMARNLEKVQRETGKSDSEMRDMLKDREAKTGVDSKRLQSLYGDDDKPTDKPTDKPAAAKSTDKPATKPAPEASTPAPERKVSGSDIDYTSSKLTGTGVNNLNIGAGGSRTDPSIAAQYGDKTRVRANVYQDKFQVGAEHDIDDTTTAGIYANQNQAGGRTAGAQVRKQFNKNTSGYVGAQHDMTGNAGNKVTAGLEFRY
jgi:hypothetical protein